MFELPDPDWYADNVLALVDPDAPGRTLTPAAEWRAWWAARPQTSPVTSRAATHGHVITTRELADLDVGRSSVRHAVRTGRWVGAGRGAVAPLDIAAANDPFLQARRHHALRAAAGTLARAELVVSGRSAAILHGLPTLTVPTAPEYTVRDSGRSGRLVSRHQYRAGTGPEDIDDWFGVPVTSVARTVVDVARHDRRGGLVVADAALRERSVTAAGMTDRLATAAGWPGVRQARATCTLASPLAESALESLVRLGLHDAGLPPPELQVRLGGYRVDMCWRQQRLVLEVDGLAKYDAEEWRREKRREQRLRAAGWRVERVTWDDLTRRWPATVLRLRMRLATGD